MNFFVVGIVRDCEKTIIPTYKEISKSLDFAKKVQYYFVESDSKDPFLKVLQKLSYENENISFHKYGDHTSKGMKNRNERISFCRNKYLDF